MGEQLRWRLVALILLLGLLALLFVWAGTIEPDPADNIYPGTGDIHENPDKYVDDRVSVSGTVIDTDPLTIEDEPVPGETITFVIDGADVDPAIGDELSVYGTLQTNNRVDAINTVHREPWEAIYMYVISFLGGVWVLARLINGWTIDTATWSIVPRKEPLLRRST